MAELQEPFNAEAIDRPSFDKLPDIPAIALLKSKRQWVAWKYEFREGNPKPTKPPIGPHTGFKVSHSDPTHWGNYNEAVTRTVRSNLDGVGYVLTEDDNLSGGDLDNCRDPDTGELAPWVAEIVAFNETYIEISPSGTGLRIIWLGKVPEAIKCDPMGVEIYGANRYLTVTGDHLPGSPDTINAAPLTEQALRKRVAQFKASQPQLPPKPSPKEDTFFSRVNTAALADLAAWVPEFFPKAKFQPGTGAYRVSSRNLGRKLEEDLSISPKGIKDWGVADQGDVYEGGRTPIGLLMEYSEKNAVETSHWLCNKIKQPPASFGWVDKTEAGAALVNQLQVKATAADEFDATPWTYVDPRTLPRRQWLYGKHYIRRFVTTTISPGGIGKTSLILAEAISMVTGQAILGIPPEEISRVWVWNGEDPTEELHRRVLATCQGHGIEQDQLNGLFLDSGRTREIIIAEETKSGARICVPIYEAVIRTILRHKIDVFIVDPFVSSHHVSENDNMAIDLVVKSWARIADITNCSIELVHHAKKTGGAEVEVEHARGAIALISAARSARTLNGMTEEEEIKAGKGDVSDRRQFFRVDNGKANMALPPNRSRWYKLESILLPNSDGGILNNGDEVGVPTSWTWPNAADSITQADLIEARKIVGTEPVFRESPKSNDWVGHALAALFAVDSSSPSGKARLTAILKVWLGDGSLKVLMAPDSKATMRPFVVCGDKPLAVPTPTFEI